MVSFGYSDDEAFAVGLTCGGTVHLFIEAFSPIDDEAFFEGGAATSVAPMSIFHDALRDAVSSHTPVVGQAAMSPTSTDKPFRYRRSEKRFKE